MEIPYRSEVPKEQTWDLTRIFKTEADWEAAFKAIKQEVKALPALEDGFTESAAVLYDRLTRFLPLTAACPRSTSMPAWPATSTPATRRSWPSIPAARAWPLNTRQLLPSFSRLF